MRKYSASWFNKKVEFVQTGIADIIDAAENGRNLNAQIALEAVRLAIKEYRMNLPVTRG